MSYSTIAHALISYIESYIEDFDIKKMSKSFGFSEIYIRELFLKNIDMPIMQYYKRRRLLISAFDVLYSNKKIVDIALESGFSNHESYTRAFRKIFGMSPSEFRLNRSLIEKRQLISKEKRSDKSIMKQDHENTILYGVRKIEQGTYESNTMFPICIKAISEYLGDNIPYAFIMAATGAAFRLVWNREIWELSNIDIYHTLNESNDIYQYGAKALKREFSFLGRDKDTTKEDFKNYIKSNIKKGYPVIALGIIGPPEPCIITGYDCDGDVMIGWNFFQNDPEFSSSVSSMDNGYFRCDSWWENTDTQAVMCIGALTDTCYSDKEVIKMATDVMREREEDTYTKGIKAYEAWKDMLLDEKWFKSINFDNLFSKLIVQNDAMVCICDGRRWAAQYFDELSEKYEETKRNLCQDIKNHFNKTSSIAEKMMSLIGNWNNTEKMLQNFASRSVREQLSKLIDSAKLEDTKAYEQIKQLYNML